MKEFHSMSDQDDDDKSEIVIRIERNDVKQHLFSSISR